MLTVLPFASFILLFYVLLLLSPLTCLCVFRLWYWACSVCPSFWILRTGLHHGVISDASSHQLWGTAHTQVWKWIPRDHPTRHNPQLHAGRLFLCQAGSGVPRQYVCGTPQSRWGAIYDIVLCKSIHTLYAFPHLATLQAQTLLYVTKIFLGRAAHNSV